MNYVHGMSRSERKIGSNSSKVFLKLQWIIIKNDLCESLVEFSIAGFWIQNIVRLEVQVLLGE
jgi:hypothetical protein